MRRLSWAVMTPNAQRDRGFPGQLGVDRRLSEPPEVADDLGLGGGRAVGGGRLGLGRRADGGGGLLGGALGLLDPELLDLGEGGAQTGVQLVEVAGLQSRGGGPDGG